MVRFIRLSLNERRPFFMVRTPDNWEAESRNIKEKQLKNSRNTVLKQLVELLSSQRDNCIFAIINPKVAYGFGDFFTFGSSELQKQ